MAKDDRDVLNLLKEELAFIEQGGYGRSVRTPWLPKSPFQDSLTCINYGYPYRAHSCVECHLMDFVPGEHQGEGVPRLLAAGEPVDHAGHEQPARLPVQSPQHRSVHFHAADPEPRHEQPVTCLHRAGSGGLQ